ncbi:MAG TPA: tRNA pseudouridine(38-40) synthase TruA [Acidimicrobiales bacterium]|nr:tRNA pseudouridine(38-40) synthase TruA [Acidimicrobiales bacterium]
MSLAPHSGGVDHGCVRWRLRVAYDGSGFHGFAVQDGQRTVAGVLGEALARVVRAPVSLTCAGRTDSGVHALDQVVHFDVPADAAAGLDSAALVKSCNSQLAPTVVVLEAEPVPGDFDARRSATARRYRYLVVTGPVADPLLAGLTWHVTDPLDLRSMAAASDALLGEHDFRAFCRRVPGADPDQPIVRRVTDTRWTELSAAPGGDSPPGPDSPPGCSAPPGLAPVVGSLLTFEIEANAFCHQMVRSLVGTLVDVGRGRKHPADMVWILRSADRRQASQPAPPGGLTLVAVRYDA